MTEAIAITQVDFEGIRGRLGTKPDDRMGIRTGFSRLDQTTRGLHPGKLYVCGARPAGGKTSFATTLTANIMRAKDQGVLFISTEATVDEIILQVTEAYAGGIPIYPNGRVSDKLEFDHLAAALWEVERQVQFGLLHIVHQKSWTAEALEREIVEHCDRRLNGAAALVIVDQASRIKRQDREHWGYALATEGLLNALEHMADRQDVPILLMSQLNRATEFQRGASMANLKHSGAFEEFAHTVLLLEKSDGHGQRLPGQAAINCEATIYVAKNRHGAVGKIPAFFFGESHTWRESSAGATA